jgi:hypothetical protein
MTPHATDDLTSPKSNMSNDSNARLTNGETPSSKSLAVSTELYTFHTASSTSHSGYHTTDIFEVFYQTQSGVDKNVS